MFRLLILLATLLPAGTGNAAPAAVTPVTLPGATRFDLPSTAVGDVFRIFIIRPDRPAPAAGYPVVYVLDANAAVGTAADAIHARQDLEPAVVVGIGYPTGQPFDIPRRFRDLTPPTPAANLPTQMPADRQIGGRDAFLDFLLHELKPRIEHDLPVDRQRQTLFGHSLGGLFALHVLFARPQAFQSYIAASPSIWWNRESILDEEIRRPPVAGVPARLLLTVGEQETRNRMRDNAASMAARLGLHADLDVRFTVLEQAGHGASLPRSLLRALDLVLKPLPRGQIEVPAPGG